MTLASLKSTIDSARTAHAAGNVITADTHLRHALSIANHLKRRDVVAGVMRCRNRLRPVIAARWKECV